MKRRGPAQPTCARVGQRLCAVGRGPARAAVALTLVVALLGDSRVSGPRDARQRTGGLSRTTATKASPQVPTAAALPDTAGLAEQSRHRHREQGGVAVSFPPQEGTQEGTAPGPWPSQCQSSEPAASHLTILPTCPPALTPGTSPTVPASGGPNSSQHPQGASLGPLSASGRGVQARPAHLSSPEGWWRAVPWAHVPRGCCTGRSSSWICTRGGPGRSRPSKPGEQRGSPEVASLNSCLKHPVSTISHHGRAGHSPHPPNGPPARHLLANLSCGEGLRPASHQRPPGPEDPPPRAHPQGSQTVFKPVH